MRYVTHGSHWMQKHKFGVVGVFCTGKIWAGQDHAFLFRDGFVNYKADYSLS
jgi:hypothetical protein